MVSNLPLPLHMLMLLLLWHELQGLALVTSFGGLGLFGHMSYTGRLQLTQRRSNGLLMWIIVACIIALTTPWAQFVH